MQLSHEKGLYIRTDLAAPRGRAPRWRAWRGRPARASPARARGRGQAPPAQASTQRRLGPLQRRRPSAPPGMCDQPQRNARQVQQRAAMPVQKFSSSYRSHKAFSLPSSILTKNYLHAAGLRGVEQPAALGRAQARCAEVQRQRQRPRAQHSAHAAAHARQAGRGAHLIRCRARPLVCPGAPQDAAQQLIGQRDEQHLRSSSAPKRGKGTQAAVCAMRRCRKSQPEYTSDSAWLQCAAAAYACGKSRFTARVCHNCRTSSERWPPAPGRAMPRPACGAKQVWGARSHMHLCTQHDVTVARSLMRARQRRCKLMHKAVCSSKNDALPV